MDTGTGHVLELILEEDCRYIRVSCPLNLIPAPGQYLLASDRADSPLPVPLFYTDSSPQGFICAAPEAKAWSPGLTLHLRGPLGRGFHLPPSARRVGLLAFDDSSARLRGLIHPALRQGAAVVLIGDSAPDSLPDEVEVQPIAALPEILSWADYVAFDTRRENLNALKERLGKQNQLASGMGAQALIRTPVPCGGMADCGICAVTVKSDWKLACKEGPVFDWGEV